MSEETSAIRPTSSKAWHQQSAEESLAGTGSSAKGLAGQEAATRLVSNGVNSIVGRRKVSLSRVFLGQFKSLMIWILVAAGIVAGIFGNHVDAIAILAIVLLNAVTGIYQEYGTGKSKAALRKAAAPQSRVRRDGRLGLIPSQNIVTGDIIELEAGDLIPPDARLLKASSLQCIESVLTGESEAVAKQANALAQAGDRSNMIYVGTSVAAGTGEAVVVATAMATELGRIAGMMEEAATKQRTPLQTKLDAAGRTPLFTNKPLLVVMIGTIVLQVLSQYHAGLGHFLKTAWMPPLDCLLLCAIGAIPLLVLEGVKVVRLARLHSTA